MIVGTLGKALGSYGAYVCVRRASCASYLVNTARPLIFSTAPPPPASRAALAALGVLERSPGAGRAAARERRDAARGARGAGLDAGRLGGRRSSRSIVGDARPRGGRSASARSTAASSPRRSARRPCPTGTSRLRLTVMATHDRGRPARRGDTIAAAVALGLRGRRLVDRPARARAGRAAALAAGATAVGPRGRERRGRLRHRDRNRGRQDVVAAAIARDRGRRGPRVAVFKPAVTASTTPAARADHELLRRAAGIEQADDEIAPYRYGPPVSPHLGRRAGRGDDRPRAAARRGGRRAAAGADVLVCEGVGGFLVPLTRRLPGPRPRARPRPAGRDRRLARPRDDQPHAADDRGGAGGRARGARRWC